MTWFRTSKYECQPLPVEVIRFTDKCVWTQSTRREIRNVRLSDWYQFWPTNEEAIAFLTDRSQRQLERAESQAAAARHALHHLAQLALKP